MRFMQFGVTVLVGQMVFGCLSDSSYGNVDMSGSYTVTTQANAPAVGTTNVRVHVKARQRNGNPIANLTLALSGDACTVTQDAPQTDANGSLWASVGTDIPGQHTVTATAILGDAHFALQGNAPVLFYPATQPGSAAIMAGTRLNARVLVPNASGDPNQEYAGTVRFESTDPRATLPLDTSLAGAGGIYTWSGAVILRTPGKQTVRTLDAESGTVFTNDTYEVMPSAAVSFGIWGMQGLTVKAGDKLSFAVAALDQSGNSTPGYTGPVLFSSTDPQAILPPQYVFTPNEGGSHVFADALSFGLVGRQTFRVSGEVIAAAEVTLTVVNSSATNFVVTGLPQVLVAGGTGSVIVTALDAFSNVVSDYEGTVHFTSTDGKAQLPADYTFTSQDGGMHRFDGITLYTAGTQTVGVVATNDSNVTGSQTGIAVAPAALASLQVNVAPGVIVGASTQVTITASDAFSNTVSTYMGTVQLTSTDPATALPRPIVFDGSSNGTQIASITVNTPGRQTIQATDSVQGNIKGASAPFWVDTVHAAIGHMGYDSCVLLGSGVVKCWGANRYGETGVGITGAVGIQPGQMGPNLSTINLGTGRTAQLVDQGTFHTCAILDNAQLKCWGSNNSGDLGLGDTGARGSSLTQMGNALPAVNLGVGRHAISVQGGWDSTCALLDDATIKCWGSNNLGQLGLGDNLNRGTALSQMGSQLPTVALGTGRSALALSVGAYFVCALLDTHQVKCWGSNSSAELGLGDTNNRGDNPNEMGDALPTVALGTGRQAQSLTAGHNHVCALLDNNTVKCWGYNNDGELGLGDKTNRGTKATQMGDALPPLNFGTGRYAVRVDAGTWHTCAVLDNGTLKCWGSNDSGQLGLGDTKNRGDSSGTMGDNLPGVNLGSGQSVQSLALGYKRSCALLQSGSMKCWGYNLDGELGLGDSLNRGTGALPMGDALPPLILW